MPLGGAAASTARFANGTPVVGCAQMPGARWRTPGESNRASRRGDSGAAVDADRADARRARTDAAAPAPRHPSRRSSRSSHGRDDERDQPGEHERERDDFEDGEIEQVRARRRRPSPPPREAARSPRTTRTGGACARRTTGRRGRAARTRRRRRARTRCAGRAHIEIGTQPTPMRPKPTSPMSERMTVRAPRRCRIRRTRAAGEHRRQARHAPARHATATLKHTAARSSDVPRVLKLCIHHSPVGVMLMLARLPAASSIATRLNVRYASCSIAWR